MVDHEPSYWEGASLRGHSDKAGYCQHCKQQAMRGDAESLHRFVSVERIQSKVMLSEALSTGHRMFVRYDVQGSSLTR